MIICNYSIAESRVDANRQRSTKDEKCIGKNKRNAYRNRAYSSAPITFNKASEGLQKKIGMKMYCNHILNVRGEETETREMIIYRNENKKDALDRSIPFYNTILRCDDYQPREVILPKGFSIVGYENGFEKAWAELEYAIGDYESESEAEKYFVDTYLKDREKLEKRARFLLNEFKEVIGSCIAWEDKKNDEWVSSLHWLVVDERYRGRGLGKALCAEVMNFYESENRLPVYIHTQPWSWKAILLYLSLGFKMQKTDSFAEYTNEYERAMATLKSVVSEKQFEMMVELSEG